MKLFQSESHFGIMLTARRLQFALAVTFCVVTAYSAYQHTL